MSETIPIRKPGSSTPRMIGITIPQSVPAGNRGRWLGGSVAVLAAGLFAVAGTVWGQALVARSYALNALLVAACLAALLRWWTHGTRGAFWAAALLVGLSLAHHGTTITLLPGYALLAACGEW